MNQSAKEHRIIAKKYFDYGYTDNSTFRFSTARVLGEWLFVRGKHIESLCFGDQEEVSLYSLKNRYCEMEDAWPTKNFDWSKSNLEKLIQEHVKTTYSKREYMEYLGYEYCLVSSQKETVPITKHKHLSDDYPYSSEDGYIVAIPFKEEHLSLVKNFLISYKKWIIQTVGPSAFTKRDYKSHRQAMDYYSSMIDAKIFTDTREYEIDWKLYYFSETDGQKGWAWRSFNQELIDLFPKLKDFDNFFEIKDE